MSEPFLVTHQADESARRDAIAMRQDIINNSNIIWSRMVKFKSTEPRVISVKVNNKEVPFRVNSNGTISICMTK